MDYIVKHTVGQLLEGKTPKQAGKLRILDPACGSGSFLLGAYRYLLDWHRDGYLEEGAGKHTKELYQGAGGLWRLTASEKKRILLNNIYGVDIDPQAVEVTKLSLLLKVLEGENEQTLQSQRVFLHERALPDLASNIKCGNSLIASDFYDSQQMSFLDEEERYRINVFDWEPAFPWLKAARGFDAVIGNPPYIRMETFKALKAYLRQHYAVHDERTDFYAYFIEREHSLLHAGGRFGMIVSNKFLRANYGRRLRAQIATSATVNRIVDLAGLPVFRGATVRTIVLITTKGGAKTPALYSPVPSTHAFLAVEAGTRALDAVADPSAYAIPQDAFTADSWALYRPEHRALLDRLRQSTIPLTKFVNGQICMGIKSGLTEAFVISGEQRHEILRSNPEAEQIIHPFLQGRHIRRYRIEPSNQFLIYTYHGIDMAPYPNVLEHLRPFRQALESRATRQAWYELQHPQFAYKNLLDKPKIVFPDISITCRFALDADSHFGANTAYFLPTADLYLLALLNSRLAYFYFRQTCAALEGAAEAYLRFFGQYLEAFPVYAPERAVPTLHERIGQLVASMLVLEAQLQRTKSPTDRTAAERQLDATDHQVERLVYDLYGLTDDEILVVEQATAPAATMADVEEA
ncbi:MAG TPA: N-6 DNA methylase [Gemmataceae bacterium]|nr:N-6 DNA methylase [Gemmataceae bacterium]